MNKTRVPKASPEPLPELASFLEPFAPLFRRHTSRDSMERYLTGLLTDLPHKTCDTIAEVIAGTSVERLQHLLTDAAWDPLSLDEARVKRLLELHPVTDGILVFDDTGLPKKGTASVGVAPQYCGKLGKIGNWKAGGECRIPVARMDQVVAYAGLDLQVKQSGKWKGQTKLSKRGSGRLRRILYLVALRSIGLPTSPFGSYYHRLVQRGMKKGMAVVAVMRKLLIVAAISSRRRGTMMQAKSGDQQ